MVKEYSEMKIRTALAWATILVVVVIVFLYVAHFLGQGGGLRNTIKEGELLGRMRLNLLRSVELGKSAVMAITDEESRNFADQSRKAADEVERDYHDLKTLTDTDGDNKQAELLNNFRACWRDFRKTDEEILALAVENTNLKAANLSYTQGSDALKRFEAALSNLMGDRRPPAEEVQIDRHAYQAVTAAFAIYNLQAPHINEENDHRMDEIESLMKKNEDQVRLHLHALSDLADNRSRVHVQESAAAFTQFMKVNAEVVRLSRLNTNVKSLQLSLGKKRRLAAECEDILNAMQDIVRNRTLKATQ